MEFFLGRLPTSFEEAVPCPQVCMEHLLGVMRNPAERTTGFAALGEMAGAVGVALTPYLPAITPLLREAVSHCLQISSRQAFTLYSSTCVLPLLSTSFEVVCSLLKPFLQGGVTLESPGFGRLIALHQPSYVISVSALRLRHLGGAAPARRLWRAWAS